MPRTLTKNDELTIVKFLAKGQSVDFTASACQVPKEAVIAVGEANGYPDTARLGWAADTIQADIDRRRREEQITPITPITRSIPTPVQRPGLVAGAQTTPPPATTASDITQLLLRASESHKASTRSKGARLADLYDEVQQLLKDEAADRERIEREKKQRAELEQEAAVLERKLKAAKDKLAQLGGRRSASSGKRAKRDNSASSPAIAARHEHQRQVFERTGSTRQEVADWAALNGMTVGKAGLIAKDVLDAFEAERLEVS